MDFKFHLPNRETIINSPNGDVMISAIDDDFPEKSIFLCGCPGSGKTTISVHRLRRLLNQGKNALLLTFQNLLRISIQNLLGIGMYNTCSHLCVYCYANTSKSVVLANREKHNLNSERIIS